MLRGCKDSNMHFHDHKIKNMEDSTAMTASGNWFMIPN